MDIRKLDEDMLVYHIELMETTNGNAETMDMLLRARRQAQRSRGQPHHAVCKETYKTKRAELKNGIASAKANAFKNLLAKEDDDEGHGYKEVREDLNFAGAGSPAFVISFKLPYLNVLFMK